MRCTPLASTAAQPKPAARQAGQNPDGCMPVQHPAGHGNSRPGSVRKPGLCKDLPQQLALYLAYCDSTSSAPMVSRNLPLCVNLPMQVPSATSLSRATCGGAAMGQGGRAAQSAWSRRRCSVSPLLHGTPATCRASLPPWARRAARGAPGGAHVGGPPHQVLPHIKHAVLLQAQAVRLLAAVHQRLDVLACGAAGQAGGAEGVGVGRGGGAGPGPHAHSKEGRRGEGQPHATHL